MARKSKHPEWIKSLTLDAEIRASMFLGNANEAAERGQKAKAEKLYAKSQYWLDRYNKLAGNS